MTELTFEEWKTNVVKYLKSEISEKIIEEKLSDDIKISKNPGNILRFRNQPADEKSDGSTCYYPIVTSTETTTPYKLNRTFTAPFLDWYEDNIDYSIQLKRFMSNIVDSINNFMIRKLVEESQNISLEDKSLSFSVIESSLSKLGYYPDTVMSNTLTVLNFYRNKEIQKIGDRFEFGDIIFYGTHLLEKNEVLLIETSEIMIQKTEMDIIFHPIPRSRELIINEKRVIWAFDNRGLGYIH